jgi:hypothetical protein
MRDVAAAVHPISPELVLVSPELRERALASLPSIDPDALFLVPPRPEVDARAPLPMAIAAYVAEALFLGAVRAFALVAVIAIAAFLLAR